ncbi:MAG: hypothetical protein GF313_13940 [Caldithrix sp.]|nr:hypothetical protein [Caldithrix sp.]
MSRIIWFFLPLLMSIWPGCQRSTEPLTHQYAQTASADDSQIADTIRALYTQDAERLALRYMIETHGRYNAPVEIPGHTIKRFYKALIRLYNADNLPGVNTITCKYSIHTFPSPVMNILIIGIDSTAQWKENWQNGQRLTGNSGIDTLMTQYHLQINRFSDFIDYDLAILTSNQNWNLYALSKNFETVHGVRYAHPEVYAGSGNDIRATVHKDHIRLQFIKGWGDCPAGCTQNHFWEYVVTGKGRVIFMKQYGSPLPE